TLERRARGLVEAVSSFYSYVDHRKILATTAEVDARRDSVSRELRWMLADLAAMKAPYSLDYELAAVRGKTQWRLDLVVRSFRIHARSEYAAGGQRVEVWRVRRVDRIAVNDTGHGNTINGTARVL